MSENNLPAKRRYQRDDISNNKKSSPLPQAYYVLQDAVNYAKFYYPTVPLTSAGIVHYAAAEFVELFTPVLSTLRLVIIDKRKDITGLVSSFHGRPVNSPDMLVLSKNDCIEIETYGKTKQSDFVTGYTYSEGKLQYTHSADSGWVWRTIGTPPRSMGAAEGGRRTFPTQMQRSLTDSKSILTYGQLDPSLEKEGFNSQWEIVKHYPEPFELNYKNISIACDALDLLIQLIEDEMRRKDTNNNPQNLLETHINKGSANVLANAEPDHNSEAHKSAQTKSSEPIIGKIRTVQAETRTNLGRKIHTIHKYLPQLQRPSVTHELEIPEQAKAMLIRKNYCSLEKAAEITKRTESELLELGWMGNLIFITPVPNGIYLYPVDEKKMSWNTKPNNVPRFLLLDNLGCKEIASNNTYEQKDFKNGCDLCLDKTVPAYMDESNSESACAWRTFDHLGGHRNIVITRDRVYVKHSELTRLIETEGKPDIPEKKPEGNVAANEPQQKKGKDEDQLESSVKSNGHHNGFYTMNEVIGLTNYSRSTINAKTKEGDPQHDPNFPKKTTLSDKPNGKVGFEVTEVDAWLESRKSKR